MGESQDREKRHWADRAADGIIKARGHRNVYTCASGITPSGTVHIGNFREIISTELVVRALRDRGKHVRFIYSWDDYDVFRKVPANMPGQEELKNCLRLPITEVPDLSGDGASSYARKNELDIEKELGAVGIHPEYIYQASRYKASEYADEIRFALRNKDRIADILNQYRDEKLADDWWPISVFSSFTGKDTTTVLSYDGDWKVRYRDDSTGDEEDLDLRNTGLVKLNWRVDWPMRWAREKVDFEPAGKDHHSAGGSFDTSREIVKIFGYEAPVSLQYDFISIKGKGGKISSSSGVVISLPDVLGVYTPEVTRFMFAKARPNTEFSISFDTDVFKIYEDYENTERVYFGLLEADEEKREKDARIYEFSQPGKIPVKESYQVSFRHLCSLLMIFDFDVDKVMDSLPDVEDSQRYRLRTKIHCAANWIRTYAPEDFVWKLQDENSPVPELSAREKDAIRQIVNLGSRLDMLDEKDLASELYAITERVGIQPKDLFRAAYLTLIARERGPRLAGFIKTLGSDRAVRILGRIG